MSQASYNFVQWKQELIDYRVKIFLDEMISDETPWIPDQICLFDHIFFKYHVVNVSHNID